MNPISTPNSLRFCACCALLFCAAWMGAWQAAAQPGGGDLRIGYVYPAGVRAGAKVTLYVGGQQLRGMSSAYVSGGGIHAEVQAYGPPMTPNRLKALRALVAQIVIDRGGAKELGPLAKEREVDDETKAEMEVLRDHPLVHRLQKMSNPELRHWITVFRTQRAQPNSAIGEWVELLVTTDAKVAPGWRELRLSGPGGYTNPLQFEVTNEPETLEQEPNHLVPTEAVLPELPMVFNGQIMPGDADRFRFHARKGQRLVCSVSARELMPFLADAVPGWFQPVLSLYDAQGNELAFADDYRFNPDPVLFFKTPEDGDYTLEIRDAIYRGRDDFVYRIHVGETPFITSVFPLGAQVGTPGRNKVEGWNLAEKVLPLDTAPGGSPIRERRLTGSNPVRYAVDFLPECVEEKSHDTRDAAQSLTSPGIVNGIIDNPGATDWYCFEGKADTEIVTEVVARTLGSPLDSLLRIVDETGAVLAWSDDFTPGPEAGVNTHAADSYVRTRLPKDGRYFVQISDTQQHGGAEYAYRLRVSPPRPDFSVTIAPSCINVEGGRSAVFHAYVNRKDGFDGPVEIVAPDILMGVKVEGGVIPPGQDHVRMTVNVPEDYAEEILYLNAIGRAKINGATVPHTAVAADEKMQAFATTHLVPAAESLIAVSPPRRRSLTIMLDGPQPVRIPLGGSAEFQFKCSVPRFPEELQYALDNPPKGLSLESARMDAGIIRVTVKADKDAVKAGYRDNLIVQALIERPAARPKAPPQRIVAGVLPAVPIEVVAPGS